MTIRGDLQAMAQSANGDHDQLAKAVIDWLTDADVLSHLGRFMGDDDVLIYCRAIGHIREKVL